MSSRFGSVFLSHDPDGPSGARRGTCSRARAEPASRDRLRSACSRSWWEGWRLPCGFGDAIEQIKHVDGAWIRAGRRAGVGLLPRLRARLPSTCSAHAPRRLAAHRAIRASVGGDPDRRRRRHRAQAAGWSRRKGSSPAGLPRTLAVLFLLTSAINVASVAVAGVLVAARVLPSPAHTVLGLGPAAAVGSSPFAAFLSIHALPPDQADARRRPRPNGCAGCTPLRRSSTPHAAISSRRAGG